MKYLFPLQMLCALALTPFVVYLVVKAAAIAWYSTKYYFAESLREEGFYGSKKESEKEEKEKGKGDFFEEATVHSTAKPGEGKTRSAR